ncbi:MAG: FkbM family methyltransferase [Candidatus Wildermuthbacteria bacterium]|nr:FkbM family methyltransferase [Candidatus Wildermuthbacteria bacterium]
MTTRRSLKPFCKGFKMYTKEEYKKIYQGNLWKTALHILRYNPRRFFKRVFLEFRFRYFQPVYRPSKTINGVIMRFDYQKDEKLQRMMYLGLYELGVTDIMRRFLKEGDTCIDAGANVGYHTALGAGFVGKSGSVHAFEPVPEYFEKLKELANANRGHRIVLNQCALGETTGSMKMYQIRTHRGERSFGTGSMFKDWLSNETVEATLEVPIMRLDAYVREKNLKNVKLLKVDVDGFEFPLLKGAEQFLRNQSPVIISEIGHPIYARLGCTVNDLLEYMARLSYFPFDMVNLKKQLSKEEINREFINEVVFKKL